MYLLGIVGKRPSLILGYEKITCNGNEGKQEYEPNVALKLIRKIKKIYGNGIDIIVGDAIYLNENFIKGIKKIGYDAVIRLKENNKALLKDAEGIFKLEKAVEWKEKRKVVNTNIHQVKAIRSWSTNLMYKGELVKVVKFEEKYKKRKEEKTDIIYVISTNLDLSNQTINKIIHSRWDIENNGFNELKNYWNMKHCFIADEKAIDVILQMIMMSYNLWEVYLYSHLHDFEKMKITKIGYIEEIRERMYRASREVLQFSSA